MNKARKAGMMLSSLSVFSGVRKRSVFGAYYALLMALDENVQVFLEKWGNFVGLLCARGYSDCLAYCLSKAAFYDENAFSRAAAADQVQKLTPYETAAVIRDIQAIHFAGQITAEDVLDDYRYREQLGELADSLPRWGTGNPVDEFCDEDKAPQRLAAYYRQNGCGKYARYRAFIWRNEDLMPVQFPDKVTLSSLIGYQTQRTAVIENTTAFLRGIPSNNVLLYGDRGTGKSSTVKAILNRYYTEGLRVVEMPKERLPEFPLLVEKIADIPLHFIIFIDDLSFSGEDKSYAQLKAVLEGGLAARPDNTLIYATSNRRHLIKETFSDRSGDELHRNDTMQETLSLSDRFGLSVNFSKPDKETYLEIVRGLAKEHGLYCDMDKLLRDAEQWAIVRGGRSPRCALQFIRSAMAELTKEEEG